MPPDSIDTLTDAYLAHLARWAPVQSCLLGDARGLGRVDPVLSDHGARAEERRELVALERRRNALGLPAGRGMLATLGALLRTRLQERMLRPRLYLWHARPDVPLDLLAEATQQVLCWPRLKAHRRKALLCEALANVPRTLVATERRLSKRPIPKVWVELALQGVDDAASLLVRDLSRWVATGLLADHDGALVRAVAAARGALERYGHFLAGAATREHGFRAGAPAIRQWLRTAERLPLTPRRALQDGKKALRQASADLRAAAFALRAHADPTLTILSLEEDRASDILREARELVSELRAFTREKELVTLPDGPACRVEKAPEYMAALTQACLDTPGALQPDAAPTRYYIALPTAEATPEERDLVARLFNRTTLTWITAHETFPGHHVQHLHLQGNVAPTHPLLRVADSETFIEGWAHYCEGLLVEHRFRDGDPKLALGVAWARVVRLCRLVAALELHAGKAEVGDAVRLFEEHALMAAEDARRETLRAVSDPTVMAYSLGRERILALRARERRRLKKAFSLRAFHDGLLAHGNAPLDLRG